jgi:nitrate/nitrite-specific signal transduction histidine kinase
VIIHQDIETAFAVIDTSARTIFLFSLGLLIVVGILAIFVSNQLANPILKLTETAQQVRAGNLDAQAEETSQDEIGSLAAAFNQMTGQIRSMVGTLERQVSDRTRALNTSTEVSRRLSTILDPDQLVKEVVEQVQQAFNYYHAHIYLFDQNRENLRMVGGTGEAGRTMLKNHHAIPAGRGLVGRAAETNQVVLVSETTADPNWLPNPLLPDTKSEIAVPIAVGESVLGALDVQHNIAGGLKQEDADLLQAIASQVAIALQNAQAYEITRRKAKQETIVNTLAQEIQRATRVEDVLQIVASGLGQSLNVKRAVAQVQNSTAANNGQE